MRPSSPTIQPSRSVAMQAPKRPWRTSRSVTGVAAATAASGTRTSSAARPTATRFTAPYAPGNPTRVNALELNGRCSPAERSVDVLDLEAHVVAVADRAELPGGGRLDARVVGDESEGIAHVRHARLEDEGALPVVEHAVRGDDAPSVVGRADLQRVQEAVVVEVKEAGFQAAGTGRALRTATVADDRDRRVDAGQAVGHREHQVAGRVEDVLVEELRRDEDRLRGIEPADEAVQVEPRGEIEGVTLEHAALHRPLAV